MKTDALISECGRYRYTLTRQWADAGKLVVFCGLNPSTADAFKDDPTVRREIAFAKDWGFGKYVKVNAYAFRSTDPKALWAAEDPIGPENTEAVLTWAELADLFVAAWGANIEPMRQETILGDLELSGVKVHALRVTKAGNPAHPLYLPKTTRPFPWP